DGVLSSRSVSESLQISEGEADSGDSGSKLDFSGDSPSRPNSDIADSPRSGLKERIYSDESPEKAELQDTDSQCSVGSPLSRINGQCSCFQNIELLKSRPAHLAVLLHHVVSQFDPAALLCYLYTDLYKQTNSKETRRVFLEFYQFFLDRAANLKVPVPEEISLELDRRRPELLPEELHRQFIQTMQDKVCPEVQRNLEDFRMTSQPLEEDKSSTMQYVILTYMKHLGVKVKEPRNLEQKRGRIGFLPKIKQSIKKEKEGEEKGKRRGFPNILGPPRRPSRHDSSANGAAMRAGVQTGDRIIKVNGTLVTHSNHLEVVKLIKSSKARKPRTAASLIAAGGGDDSLCAVGRAMEMQKPRHPKHSPTASSVSPEPPECSKARQSGSSSDGTDGTPYPPANPMSPLATGPFASPEGSKDSDAGVKQPGEAPPASESMDGTPRTPNNTFEFPSPLENLQEEEGEAERMVDMGTPKPFRKMDSVGFADVQSEDELCDFDMDMDPPNWQQLVSREVLMGLKPYEIKRQEVINELFYTERAHVRTLKVLHNVFYQRVTREGILSSSDKRKIFSNLEDILGLHVALNDQMKSVRKRNETSVIGQIGEDLLSW
ncbi:hypothetical protein EK904_011969, partial [Melospiza melodia maxima]